MSKAEPLSSAARLKSALAVHGLIVLGALTAQDAAQDAEGLDAEAAAARAVLLVGNAGPAMWRAFAAARAAGPALAAHANPMDAWTQRVVTAAAAEAFGSGVRAVFPFEGPPYYPFQRWAMRTGAFHASPIGPLVHAEYGLWAAFRAAVIIPAPDSPAEDAPAPGARADVSPCETCAEKPCLSACPVNAFSAKGYDVPVCTAHLAAPKGADCMGGGCLARRACPYGQIYAHAPAQAAFHMRRFLGAHGA